MVRVYPGTIPYLEIFLPMKLLSWLGSATEIEEKPSDIFSINSTAASLPSMSSVLDIGPALTKLEVIEYRVDAPCSSWSIDENCKFSLAEVKAPVLAFVITLIRLL